MAKRKKEKRSSGRRSKALNQLAQTGDSGMIYREFGDRDAKDVVDVENLSYRGIGYTQDGTSANQWADLLRRTGTADSGEYYRHQKKVYLSAGGTGSEVRI
mgnify:CR=1 FL=1